MWFRRSGNWVQSRMDSMIASKSSPSNTSSGGPSPESVASTVPSNVDVAPPTTRGIVTSAMHPRPRPPAQSPHPVSSPPVVIATAYPLQPDDAWTSPQIALPFDQQAVTVPMFSNTMSSSGSLYTLSQYLPSDADPLQWMFDRDPAAGPVDDPQSLVHSFQSSSTVTATGPMRPQVPPMAVFLDPPNGSTAPALSVWVPVANDLLADLADPSLHDHAFFSPAEMQHNFDSYFRAFHDHFPFLSRPTTQPGQSHHLLLATIISLGAAVGPDSHYAVARQIHDRLRTLLFSVGPLPFLSCVVWPTISI